MAKFWNDENSALLAEKYNAVDKDNTKLKAIAMELGTNEHGARSKLVAMKEYKPNETTSNSSGANVVRKPEIVVEIRKQLGLEGDVLASLDKAVKADLEALLRAVTPPAE